MFNFIKTFLKSDPLDDILAKTHSYKNIDNTTNITFIHKDIIGYNKTLETILKLDLLNQPISKHALNNDSSEYTTVKHWCTNNNRLLSDLNSEIYKWCKYSKELKILYTQLNTIRKSGTHISFNTRILKPYIINIEAIAEILNNT